MLYFLCSDRKDRKYLDHDLDDYVRHSHSRREASVYLKPAEKTFNVVKEHNELVLAGAGIFGRLEVVGVKIG